MKKYIFPAIAVVLTLILMCTILLAPYPKRCAICDSIPHHAPALVNLATGEVGELAVYEPHPVKVAELNEYQQGGTFSFICVAGLHGYQDTANWETHISIPVYKNEYRKDLFCHSCREQLNGNSDSGFALLDMRTPGDFSILPIIPGNIQSLRCYRIEIQVLEDATEIVVYGDLKIVDGYIQ